jgi:hypothetical protein
MKLGILVSLVLLSATTVHADEALDTRWRLENSLGMRGGSFLVNSIDMAKLQGFMNLGIRRERWNLFGEYSLMELGIDQKDVAARGIVGSTTGLAHRFGTNVRYAYGRSARRGISGEIYAEAGVGVQHMRWDQGGYWTRPDILLGVGTTTWGATTRKHFGTTLGLRVLLSPRSDVPDNAPVACGGPCDMATRPTGLDRSFMFDVAFHFGT